MRLTEKLRNTIRDVEGYPKPGIVFKDITPVLADAGLVRDIVSEIGRTFRRERVTAVAGIEARGFILGSLLAQDLGCGFIPVRKSGKLPFQTRRQQYELEYGTAEIEMHADAVKPGDKVLIHDDLLATGGTACAAGKLVRSFGGEVAGFSFLINLSFLPGAGVLEEHFGLVPHFLVKY